MISSVPLGLLVRDSRALSCRWVAVPQMARSVTLPLCMSVVGIDELLVSDTPSMAIVEIERSSFCDRYFHAGLSFSIREGRAICVTREEPP